MEYGWCSVGPGRIHDGLEDVGLAKILELLARAFHYRGSTQKFECVSPQLQFLPEVTRMWPKRKSRMKVSNQRN